MTLLAILFLIAGCLLARAAIRSAILAAQLGKLSEDRWQERADGDWPAPSFVCTQGCNCNPAPVLDSSFHEPEIVRTGARNNV